MARWLDDDPPAVPRQHGHRPMAADAARALADEPRLRRDEDAVRNVEPLAVSARPPAGADERPVSEGLQRGEGDGRDDLAPGARRMSGAGRYRHGAILGRQHP